MTPAFSAGDSPSIDAVLDALLNLLPPAQRRRGRTLLQPILRHRLAGLATHSRPGSLAEVVYERLAGLIESADTAAALDRLRDEALRNDVDSLLQDTLALAIARFGVEHPSSAKLSDAWAAHHPDWLGRDVAFYRAEAARLRRKRRSLLSRLDGVAQGLAGSLRPELLRAELNLKSASAGRFATASGSLADFLRDAGAKFQYLDFE